MTDLPKIAVIGGGISGLLAAYFLKKKGFEVAIIEKSHHLGGRIASEVTDGRTLDWGPQSLLANSLWQDLIKDLQISPIEANPYSRKQRFIWENSQKQKVPSSPKEILTTPLLSFAAKWRIATEAFRQTKIEESDLSLYDFFSKHFHPQLAENLLAPFVRGIYAGDIRRLSTKTLFPKIWDASQRKASVIRGMFTAPKQSRSKLFSFAGGFASLVKALANKIGAGVLLKTEILEIKKNSQAWNLKLSLAGEVQTREFDALIFACPAFETARILREYLEPTHIEFLQSISYETITTWNLVFQKPKNFPSAFGALLSPREQSPLLGSLWNSEVFEAKAANNEVICTQFLKGNFTEPSPEVLNLVKRIAGLDSEPLFSKTWLHTEGLPQALVGHADKMRKLIDALPLNIGLAGNYLEGVGLSTLIETSKKAVERIQLQA